MEERTTLKHPDKKIKKNTPLNPTELLPQKFTLQRQLANQKKHQEAQKQRKSHIKLGEKKNMQSKEMEDSSLKEINEIEVCKLSDIEFKRMVIRMLKDPTDNYRN